MRTAARADRIASGESRRSDRSCGTRRGEMPGRSRAGPGAARPNGEIWQEIWQEIWFEQDSRGLTARELIRLAQAVRLRPGRD